MDGMSEERFEEWVRDNADSYHKPGEVPREAMWDAITAARQTRVAGHVGRRTGSRVWLATAATLLVTTGVGLGYWLRGGETGETAVASVPAAASDSDLQRLTYDVASNRHFTAAEALLTTFRSNTASEGDDAVRGWARDLLSSTRLLMDSPAGDDAVRRRLLEDLEYVLAQIVQLPTDAPPADRALVDGAIARQDMMTRIRSSIPAGFPSGT
jgi:hypothetical protein